MFLININIKVCILYVYYRVYSTVIGNGRTLQNDTVICGYKIPKGVSDKYFWYFFTVQPCLSFRRIVFCTRYRRILHTYQYVGGYLSARALTTPNINCRSLQLFHTAACSCFYTIAIIKDCLSISDWSQHPFAIYSNI